jgi:hypothetical protein
MEGGRYRVRTSLRGGEESKVLETRWTARVGCGLGNRYQQNTYSVCKTYLHGERLPWGPSEPASEGRSPGS